jgi:hypothetical protein
MALTEKQKLEKAKAIEHALRLRKIKEAHHQLTNDHKQEVERLRVLVEEMGTKIKDLEKN